MEKLLLITYVLALLMVASASAAVDLNDGLRAYYSFDNDAADVFKVYNGTVDNATQNATCLVGGCYNYNGHNQHIEINYTVLDATHENISFSFWVRDNMTGETALQYYLRYRNAAGIFSIGRIITPENTISAATHDGGTKYVGQTGPPPPGWFHVVYVIENDNGHVLYVNGVENDSDPLSGLTSYSNHAFTVGSNLGAGQFHEGQIDELGIWTKALNTSEVSALYNSGAGFAYPFEVNSAPNGTRNPADRDQQAYAEQDLPLQIIVVDDQNDTITYQWSKNGTPVLGATLDTYNFNEEDADLYNVSVEFSDGEFNKTDYWMVTLQNNPPNITGQNPSENLTINHKESVTLSVTVDEPENQSVTYQWIRNATIIGTESTYTYNPPESHIGLQLIEVQVSDGQNSDQANWNVNVTPSSQYEASYEAEDVAEVGIDITVEVIKVLFLLSSLVGLFLVVNWLGTNPFKKQ